MARTDPTSELRQKIAAERDDLARSVDELRAGIAKATDISSKLRPKLPLIAAGALGAGFMFGGGIGATMRYLARRGRESHHTRARLGRFRVVEDD